MSKEHNSFINAIKSYLDSRAASDELFAKAYAKENKSLDECCNYILSEAKKRGNAVAMTDEEVYGLSVHYYDEDNIKVNKVSHARVSTPTIANVELTEDEKAAAKQRALHAYEVSEQKRLEEVNKRRLEKKRERASQQQEVQPSLFEF